MHWLPLVAMVIASALPFPHSPVASTVAVVTEPGRSLDNHTENLDDSNATLPASQAPMDYNSHNNASHKDYNMTIPGKAYNTEHLSTTGVDKKLNYPSKIKERAQALKWKQKQQRYQSKSNFHRENINSVGLNVDSNTEVERLRSTNGSERQYYSSQDNYVLEDYKSESSRAGDDISPRHSPDTRTDKDDLRPPRLSEKSLGGLQEEEELLFLDAHPRVLFSPSNSPPKHPPLLLMLETGMLPEEGEDEEDEVADADGHTEGHGDRETERSVPQSRVDAPGGSPHPAPRLKRSHLSHTEKPVCDVQSDWVMDKKMAIDSYGRTVSIVPFIKTATGPLKQYFYETTCRRPEQKTNGALPQGAGASAGEATKDLGVNGNSCLGVDKKQWVSECKAKHTYVRALTSDANGLQGWRWIRINTSCVCVLLSRVKRHHRGG
ncbi:uncharacterized protein LOC105012934 [Esox lucius]|uniref:Neurotrophin-4 n=1 Tax=Esox lucius TaxID=8010 RepID=A0A3P8YU13_ESOLU|nr:uncharacterized protein LOC105012934 [Esox lucius]XP_010872403.1 uncharacterized protein LOC105012934 [Esox lucius]